MKKMILTLVALMTWTLGNAETNQFRVVEDDADRYDMSCDLRRLAAKLDLNDVQMDAVQAIQDSFNNEMLTASTAPRFQRRNLVHQAVRKDIHHMHQVLNDDQFNTYMMLLGATLHNKHL